jgi:hypothetical protein
MFFASSSMPQLTSFPTVTYSDFSNLVVWVVEVDEVAFDRQATRQENVFSSRL